MKKGIDWLLPCIVAARGHVLDSTQPGGHQRPGRGRWIQLLALLAMGDYLLACSDDTRGEEAGLPLPDAGVAGPAPKDRVFSIGITDNAGGPPQTAAVVNLRFGDGTAADDTVVARKVAAPPTLDADSSDWAGIPISQIPMTGPGVAIGMTEAEWDAEWTGAGLETQTFDFGISSVSARAAWDEQNIYFLFEWSDSTENRFRRQWRFTGTTWSRSSQDEDRLYLGFAIGDTFPAFANAGCAAACHVNERLGEFTAEATAFRFSMHTNGPGQRGDVWHWKATRTNPLALVDDQYWGELARSPDGPIDFVADNLETLAGGVRQPKYMGEGGINSSPAYIFLEDEGAPAAVPFDPGGAVEGVTLPGFVHKGASPQRANIRAVGKWADGKWTLELSRALTTDDANDVQFPLE